MTDEQIRTICRQKKWSRKEGERNKKASGTSQEGESIHPDSPEEMGKRGISQTCHMFQRWLAVVIRSDNQLLAFLLSSSETVSCAESSNEDIRGWKCEAEMDAHRSAALQRPELSATGWLLSSDLLTGVWGASFFPECMCVCVCVCVYLSYCFSRG